MSLEPDREACYRWERKRWPPRVRLLHPIFGHPDAGGVLRIPMSQVIAALQRAQQFVHRVWMIEGTGPEPRVAMQRDPRSQEIGYFPRTHEIGLSGPATKFDLLHELAHAIAAPHDHGPAFRACAEGLYARYLGS